MIHIYKPNKSNTGCAMNIQIGRAGSKRELSVFIQSILQYSWDDSKKTGSFGKNREDKDKNVTFKLTEVECGSVISAIESRHEFSAFHSHDQNKTTIKLTPWDKEIKSKGPKGEYTYVQPAFGLTITRNGNQTFKIPIECGEARNICALLKIFLEMLFRERFESREADLRDRQNKKQQESSYTNNDSPDHDEDEDAPF